jgi:hypothetical protein
MVMKKASPGIPLSGRVPGRASGPSDLASTTAVACSMVRGKLIGSFRFTCRGQYIGGRAASGGGPAGLTP